MELTDGVTIKVRDLEVDVVMEWGELRALAKMLDGVSSESAAAPNV